MTIEQIKQSILGEWTSITPEVRPSIARNADGTMKSFYLRRSFKYMAGDTFELEIINFADAYGKIPLVKIWLKGHIFWQGEHSIAPGAHKVNFVADEGYEVTPLAPLFAEVLNQVARQGFHQWKVNDAQSILGKAFPPFGLVEGQIFAEFDLIYVLNDMMFWGARHVDGHGFDKEENRPTNLQIPMVRK